MKLEENKKISKRAACELYFNKNQDFLAQNGINSVAYLRNLLSNSKSNKQREIFNSGETIQTAFCEHELVQFGEKYAKWVQSQKVQQGNREGNTQAQHGAKWTIVSLLPAFQKSSRIYFIREAIVLHHS